MFRKVLILATVVIGLLACEVQGAVIDSNWVAGDGLWGNASNWDPAIVPDNDGNTFVVTMHGGVIDDDPCVVQLAQNRTIDQLDCDGWVVLDINGAVALELEDANGLTNSGKLETENELEIVGNVTNTAGAEISTDLLLRITGNLDNEAFGFIEVGYLVGVDHGGSQSKGFIDNAGRIEIRPNGQLYSDRDFNNTGQIQIYDASCQADKVFYNRSTGTISGFGNIYGWLELHNEGTIYGSGGSLTIISSGTITNSGALGNKPLGTIHIKTTEDMNNTGTIEVHSGGVAFDCNLTNGPNGTIQLLSGNLSAPVIIQKTGANFSGFGGITGNVVIDPNGSIELTGPTNIVGDVTIGTNATLEISDGTTLVTGYTTNNGTIHVKSGGFIPQGGITDNGRIIWEGGAEKYKSK
jgi:hypothetical protein